MSTNPALDAPPLPGLDQEPRGFDVHAVRKDFPILDQLVYGKPLVYLDNAATSQKPRAVIDAISRFYATDNSNVHRGVHLLSQRATDDYEGAREKVRRFLNAADEHEIVFLRGTTEAVNLVASSFGSRLGPGDEILITALEHHSNIVPWQLLCQRQGCTLRVVPIDDRGQLILEEYERLLSPRTKLVSVTHVSNALGTINPIREMAALAHRVVGAAIFVDGAQAAPHLRIDVQDLDVDFYAFSGHKAFGPTGIGALYAKASWLNALPPYQGGGDMIASVSFEETTYNTIPFKFEAGTGDIAGAVGLGAAIDYVESIGIEAIGAHEHDLLEYATGRLSAIDGLRIIGTAEPKASVVSFVVGDIHAHDVGTVLDRDGIAVRTGHHCAQPIMTRFGLPATARASFAFYNTREEVDALVAGIEKAKRLLGA